MSRYVRSWTWGRANLDGITLIAADVETKKAYTNEHIPILLLAQDGRILTDNGYPLKVVKRNVVFHPGSKRSYPSELSLRWEDGQNCIQAEFSNTHLIQTENVLFGLPNWLIRFINVVYRPYYFRLEAELDLEIVWDGVHTHKQGRALYEMMLLDR